MTKQELVQIIEENFINKRGIVDLAGLKFNRGVNISRMEVKGSLYQGYQKVEGDLYQDYQKVEENLYQRFQKVEGDLYQGYQEVERSLTQNYQEVKGEIFN